MKTDRELLELAARAAGIELIQYEIKESAPFFDSATLMPWNPLTNDGDALRLAVKLNITIGPSMCGREAYARTTLDDEFYDEYGNDKVAATRRAIVRAAAEIQLQKEREQ